MDTQYCGSNSCGVSGYSSSRRATSIAAAAYRNTPTDQLRTAITASPGRSPAHTGSRVAATTATDWLATTQTNHDPFADATTGRSVRPSTAIHGMR